MSLTFSGGQISSSALIRATAIGVLPEPVSILQIVRNSRETRGACLSYRNDDIPLHTLFQHFELVGTKLKSDGAISFSDFIHDVVQVVTSRACPTQLRRFQ